MPGIVDCRWKDIKTCPKEPNPWIDHGARTPEQRTQYADYYRDLQEWINKPNKPKTKPRCSPEIERWHFDRGDYWTDSGWRNDSGLAVPNDPPLPPPIAPPPLPPAPILSPVRYDSFEVRDLPTKRATPVQTRVIAPIKRFSPAKRMAEEQGHKYTKGRYVHTPTAYTGTDKILATHGIGAKWLQELANVQSVICIKAQNFADANTESPCDSLFYYGSEIF